MIDDGEIPFLDADPLDSSLAAEDTEQSSDQDSLALERIEEKLRRSGRSHEQAEEMAAELYNRICHPIRLGTATEEHVRRAATLLGESPQELRERLR